MKAAIRYELTFTKDFLGNDVYVGSKVVFSIGSAKKLRVGEVKTLGESSILVEDFTTHREYKVLAKKFVLPSIPKELKGILG